MIKNILVLVLCLFAWLFRFPSQVDALAKFSTSYQIYYRVDGSGKTHVNYVINQKNNLSVVYATDFGLSINGTNLENIKVKDEGVPVSPDIIKTLNQTSISFPFTSKIVGKDKNHTFTIEYETSDIATKFGNTWQIDIPRLEPDESIVEQTVVIVVPEGFPSPAYIDPKPDVVNGNTYYFSGKKISHKTISAIFGTTQYFEGSIAYHLENDQLQKVKTSIALPPDTAYQTVFYKELSPRPVEVYKDPDGNILGVYELGPKEKIDINLKLAVRLQFNPSQSLTPPSENHLEKNHIWNFDNGAFGGQSFKNLTSPKSIYDFVVDKMSYDYQKLTRERSVRTPAAESLINSQSAICTDFTDVFVALARRAGIYARELQGFAFSENPDLKPLSLTRDVLHAWPEYFDKERNTWIQIDPTWANTTRGIDYFNKMDFNHIVFAIHGYNPESPVPAGGYKGSGQQGKDILLEPVESSVEFPKPEATIRFVKQDGDDAVFEIVNTLGVSFTGRLTSPDNEYLSSTSQVIDVAPFSAATFRIGIKKQPFISKIDSEVIINIDGRQYPQSFSLSGGQSQALIFSGIGGFLVISAITARSIHLRKRKQAPDLHW